jgi:hypothetical protein
MNTSNTEKLVRKVFGNSFIPIMGWTDKNINLIARAARRFVRMEQAEKDKRIADMFIKKSNELQGIKLPKHFGEFRDFIPFTERLSPKQLKSFKRDMLNMRRRFNRRMERNNNQKGNEG